MDELFDEIDAFLARGERPPQRMEERLFPSRAFVGYDADSMVRICAWLLQSQDSPELRAACVECAEHAGKLRFVHALNGWEGSTHLTEMPERGPDIWSWRLESDAHHAAIQALRKAARIFDDLAGQEVAS